MNKKLIEWLSGGDSYNAYYQAWLTQIIADGGTEPSASVKTAQNALIRDLDAAGYMARMKFGWFLHAGDKTTCRRNIKAPGTYRMSEVNTVTFLEANGCKSDGTSAWNTTVPGNAFDLSDFTFVTYVTESSTTSSGIVFGARVQSGFNVFSLSPFVGGGVGQRDNSSSGGATNFSNANHKGLYVMTYDGANSVVYKDGVKDTDAQTYVAPNITAPFLLCARNSNGTTGVTVANTYARYTGYAFAFDRFNDSDESTLRGLLTTYNTAAGLP